MSLWCIGDEYILINSCPLPIKEGPKTKGKQRKKASRYVYTSPETMKIVKTRDRDYESEVDNFGRETVKKRTGEGKRLTKRNR